MLKIGEIAVFCGLPVKTLRYYNEIDLLKPHYIDPCGGMICSIKDSKRTNI
ncbi:MAG TPA: MerR family DNA-binding transcriptional regulator [Mobilitalea sp.]|nr:MerR family DNA-binding transcriptional regulator [Mobilitalea sp.]